MKKTLSIIGLVCFVALAFAIGNAKADTLVEGDCFPGEPESCFFLRINLVSSQSGVDAPPAVVSQHRHKVPILVLITGTLVGGIEFASFDGRPITPETLAFDGTDVSATYVLRDPPIRRSGSFYVRTTSGQFVGMIIRVMK